MAAAPGAAPVVDLRATLPVVPAGDGTADAWLHAVGYLRHAAGATEAAVATITPFDHRCGAGATELASVLTSLDAGHPVAFYGWWPTVDAAATTEILGIDAMEVPPPDRKGNGLVDGHAVVIVGYGRHDAFPGGGYLIVRSGWHESGWGDQGDGYMPFTYVRAYATEMVTMGTVDSRPGPEGGGPSREPSSSSSERTIHHGEPSSSSSERTIHHGEPSSSSSGRTIDHGAGHLQAPRARWATMEPRDEVDAEIDRQARCADPRASLTHLFFSDDLIELARARAICSVCPVREPCLLRALERQEPCGVWGGEVLVDGVVVAEKRGRGRPPKVPRPRLVVDEITGLPLVPIAV